MTAPRAGTLVADRYRLLRRIGKGGMGTVWAAEDVELWRRVAVKTIASKQASHKKALARFKREARAAAQLRSPHIVEVYDFGTYDGWPFIVMELLEGEELHQRIARQPPTLAEAARIAAQLGRALTTAHEAGVIHRDLKPSNVFLVPHHGEDLLKVFDFGVAKAVGSARPARDLTTEGSIIGTPRYMSPEQLRGEGPLGPPADLWSFAVILYHLGCGQQPFGGNNPAEVIARVLDADPPRPTSLRAELPATLDAFFARALAKDANARFATAQELAAAFVAACQLDGSVDLDTPTVTAPPADEAPPPAPDATTAEGTTVARRPARRRVMPAAIALIVVAGIAVGASALFGSDEPAVVATQPPVPRPAPAAPASASAGPTAMTAAPSASAARALASSRPPRPAQPAVPSARTATSAAPVRRPATDAELFPDQD